MDHIIDQHPFDMRWAFGVRAHGTTKLLEKPDAKFELKIQGKAEHIGGPTNIDVSVPVSGNASGEHVADTPVGKVRIKFKIEGWDLQPRTLGLLLTVSVSVPLLGERTAYDRSRFAGQRRALAPEAMETMFQRYVEVQRQLGDELGVELT